LCKTTLNYACTFKVHLHTGIVCHRMCHGIMS